ncbi:hypothetical protein FCV25MIE_15151, partial [Fagus crenata]
GPVEKGSTVEKEDDEVGSPEEIDVVRVSPPRHQHEGYLPMPQHDAPAGQMDVLNWQVNQLEREFRGGGASSSSGAPAPYYYHTPVNFYAPYHPQPPMGFNVPPPNVGGS